MFFGGLAHVLGASKKMFKLNPINLGRKQIISEKTNFSDLLRSLICVDAKPVIHGRPI